MAALPHCLPERRWVPRTLAGYGGGSFFPPPVVHHVGVKAAGLIPGLLLQRGFQRQHVPLILPDVPFQALAQRAVLRQLGVARGQQRQVRIPGRFRFGRWRPQGRCRWPGQCCQDRGAGDSAEGGRWCALAEGTRGSRVPGRRWHRRCRHLITTHRTARLGQAPASQAATQPCSHDRCPHLARWRRRQF